MAGRESLREGRGVSFPWELQPAGPAQFVQARSGCAVRAQVVQRVPRDRAFAPALFLPVSRFLGSRWNWHGLCLMEAPISHEV